MVHYKLVKITIDAAELAEIIIDVAVRHYGLSVSIVSDCSSIFTSKFWLSLCYFLEIKQRLSAIFYSQTNGQTERQNSIIEAYLQVVINYEQDDWARLLPMAKFADINAKNVNIGYTLFELNCGYNPYVSYEEETNPHLKSKSADELATKLKNLMTMYRNNLLHA